MSHVTRKICLGTDHLIFGREGGGGAGFFPQDFLPIRKQEIFFSQSENQNNFFGSKQKHFFFFFSKQHNWSKCILLDLYVRIFLEPNIHGYIVYMFVYTCILDIWVRVYMSRDMIKPTKWLCAQQRLRSACLIRVFTVRMKKHWVLSYALSAQRRL